MAGFPAWAFADLYWLPLGAGGRSVRLNGRVFEAVTARIEHRAACDLYHSALEGHLPGTGRFVIEMTPIPDVAEAVDSPQRMTDDPGLVQRLWDAVPGLPRLVWGRDELGAGDMWNSNSVISWLLARSGLDAESIRPPAGGARRAGRPASQPPIAAR